jgi:FtsP/CotA-like multicopper oxidase with cupredoxin domain
MKDADLVTTHLDGGFEIAPATVNSIGILYPGERMDINLKWRETKVSVPYLKVTLDLELVTIAFIRLSTLSDLYSRNFKYPNPALNSIQTFPALPRPRQGVDLASYKDSDQALESKLKSSFDIQTASALQPPAESIPHAAQHTLVVYTKTQKLSRFGNRPMGFINRTSWSPQSPPLIAVPRELWDDHQLVPFVPLTPGQEQATWVDIVINNLDDGSHPFHLHGHDFWVLKTHRSDNGWGSYDLYASEEKVYFNLDAVVRKDTVMVPRRGFAIIRFRADNKGIWMFHCHLLVHLKSGMAMGIQVGDSDT